jgi:hypothetical protein
MPFMIGGERKNSALMTVKANPPYRLESFRHRTGAPRSPLKIDERTRDVVYNAYVGRVER